MNQWHNCPNLATFWYNIISSIVYLYAVYSSGSRYYILRTNSNDPRYGYDWNENFFLLHLAALLLSTLFWLVFVFASLFKTGSLANDYVEINAPCTVLGTHHISWNTALILKKILSRVKNQCIPFNSAMHLCGAFLLLVPIPIIVKQESDHDISYSDNPSVHRLLTIYSAEIINFIIAAISITVKLPSVFLSSSTQISIVFSFILFISNVNILVRSVLHQLLPLQSFACDIVRIQAIDTVLFVLAMVHYILIYEMARSHYVDLCLGARLDSYDQSSPKSAINSTRRPKLLRFWPNILSAHFLVTAIILSVDQYRLKSGRMPLLFFDVTVNMIHFLNWLIIILLFSFKTDWHFKLSRTTRKPSILSHQTSLKLPNLSLKPADPIYTCFQQMAGVRSVSSESSRNQNHDFSSNSSSSGSHASEKVVSYKHIPSISKQLDVPEHNYEDLPSFKSINRAGKGVLREITEENHDQITYFKSPNISQRSSNIHSSDSGIGSNFRDHTDYGMVLKSPDASTQRSRSMSVQRYTATHEYDINEEFSGSMNIYSDV